MEEPIIIQVIKEEKNRIEEYKSISRTMTPDKLKKINFNIEVYEDLLSRFYTTFGDRINE